MRATNHPAILTSDKVYLSLREDIALGRLVPGERLETDRLAEMKKVSRTPVREALRQLAHDGLIETIPNQGARVRKTTWDEIVEIYEIRESLEAIAARRLAELRPGRELIDSILEACDRRHQAKTLIDLELADLQFHRTIVRASGKKLISSILESRFILVSAFRLSRQMIARRIPEHDKRVDNEHEQIVAAIEAGDADLTFQIMRAHIQHAMEYIRQMGSEEKIPDLTMNQPVIREITD